MSGFSKNSKMKLDEAYVKAEEVLGRCGRMLSSSKTGIPGHLTVFNANVCTKAGKIWFGDLDVTQNEAKLKALAEALGEKVYVLREMDGRFDNEGAPLLDRAVASF
jgi:hypothetical protein